MACASLLTLAAVAPELHSRISLSSGLKEIHGRAGKSGNGDYNLPEIQRQATNPPLKWSEVGPVAKVPQAATKPDFPGTSVSYCRWYWNAIEPERASFGGKL